MLIQVTDLITGEYQDILKTFSDNLNFGIKQFTRTDRGWGAIDKNTGQWSGMISNLIK